MQVSSRDVCSRISGHASEEPSSTHTISKETRALSSSCTTSRRHSRRISASLKTGSTIESVGRSSIEHSNVAEAMSLCFSRPVPDEPRERTAELEPLEQEARVFSLYLVGRIPRDALRQRYADAVRALLPNPADARGEAVVAFARRHPWCVSFLDAACGLVRPGARLREKIFVMAAVLEASPDFA